eukprot:TRINITY_DN3482_c0_g1_i4.p1 TRINITY_DN3482_c0_g1~~TRINITY_DN3482_c0_g1_i4.p1  ORF type:complete len:1118 (-),score=428.30 TRINITY_DN3482_c0_g1_i4:1315-4668(-)
MELLPVSKIDRSSHRSPHMPFIPSERSIYSDETRSDNAASSSSARAGHRPSIDIVTPFSASASFPQLVDAAPQQSTDADDRDPDSRYIQIDDRQANVVHRYPSNTVRTSKYTVITFVPKNLFEQFMRIANIYFLVIAGLQQIPNISPTGQWTTLSTLVVVLLFTALREAYEDIQRHRQDNEVNNREVTVIRNGRPEQICWHSVRVGDIVKAENRQYIAADLVLLSTSEPQSIAYIETANLDGETNLKIRRALPETTHYNSPEAMLGLSGGRVVCEKPNRNLYKFSGRLELRSALIPVANDQVLLRGSMLRNTKWAYGIAIFTGHDTKVMQNATKAPVKRTSIEKAANVHIIAIFVLLLLMAVLCAVGNAIWQLQVGSYAWYLQFDANAAAGGALSFLTFVILFNNLIPISLYVSVELVKLAQAYFINNDVQMYHAENDTPALARTSNLNEELGQVQYIFSDKTGTLTRNKMEFRKCTIGGVQYGQRDSSAGSRQVRLENDTKLVRADSQDSEDEDSVEPPPPPRSGDDAHNPEGFNDPTLLRNLYDGHSTAEVIHQFLLVLSVCHTVIPEVSDNDPNRITYEASSPDEAALVEAARRLDYVFCKRDTRTVTVRIRGVETRFELLQTLHFTSNRKRMSVIVREPNTGRILLLAKGADNVILQRLLHPSLQQLNSGEKTQPYEEATVHLLEQFALEGLRTLCLAMAVLDEQQYLHWLKIYNAAAARIADREEELEKAAELVETDMMLLGATAIEDKLQKGVPETIATLSKAGIKIWVLTGDKQETAINIGYSCRLLTHEMELMKINKHSAADVSEKLKKLLEKHEGQDANNASLALVIDGETLGYALDDTVKHDLLALATKCKSVICCRVSPLQKALVVSLVRDQLKVISLAIGDGANDVPMIQAAHVGVGISGEEGLQASRSADYAIAQFRFLKRLLLVHGRLSYRRIARVISYCFYKNILLQYTQFWFVFLNGWSGQSLYERWTLSVYNVFFTFFAVLLYGIMDKDIEDASIMKYPQLYRMSASGYLFNGKVIWTWILNAVFQSVVCFGAGILTYGEGVLYSFGACPGCSLLRCQRVWSVDSALPTCLLPSSSSSSCTQLRQHMLGQTPNRERAIQT